MQSKLKNSNAVRTSSNPVPNPPPGEWVTPSEYARFKGVSTAYVAKFQRESGVPVVEGKMELSTAERYWANRPNSRQKKIDFEQARTKKMEADARLAEMSADTMARQLVETESVVETWERSFAKIKTKLTGLPNKLGPILALQDDPKIVTNQLKNAINKTLNELATSARRRNRRRAKQSTA
jgi:macrodomain Ter protein organizer (MatP/YcbG family)